MFRLAFLFIFTTALGAFGSTVNINSGLIGYFPFNGNSNDESGSGRDASIYSFSNTVLSSDQFGNPNSSYRFLSPVMGPNGGVDPVLWGNGLNLVGKSMTISFWIFGQFSQALDDYAGVGVSTIEPGSFNPGDTGDSWGRHLHIYASWERIRFSFFFNDLDASSSSLNPGWNFLAFTYDSLDNSRKIWANGSVVASDIAAYGFRGLNEIFSINGRFETKMDEVRFYDRVLSQEELNAVSLIPEPSSLSLLLAGGAVLMAGRRRKV